MRRTVSSPKHTHASLRLSPASSAQSAKSLQFLVRRELIKQAINSMIALNGPEKNGAWEGRRQDGGVIGGWRVRVRDAGMLGCWVGGD